MADNRLSRSEETREKKARNPQWKRPEVLPSPDPQEGWTFHWVRVSIFGEPDATNISAKLREGWEPCRAKDHPEIKIAIVENERFEDNIVLGGLMLCKAPVELVKERTEHYQEQTNAQMNAVDNNLMRESDPRMPMFSERKSEVTFGKG